MKKNIFDLIEKEQELIINDMNKKMQSLFKGEDQALDVTFLSLIEMHAAYCTLADLKETIKEELKDEVEEASEEE